MTRSCEFRKFAFLAIAALLSSFQTAVPAIAQQDILADLFIDEKLHAPADILADFVKGEPETAVIVILRPTAAAMDLAVRSRASAQLPAEFTRPGVATYYNLQDESIRSQLQATVKATVSRVLDELGANGMKVTQRFSYQFGFSARVTPAALARIVRSPDVIAVEKDSILQAHLAQGIPLMNATTVRGTYTGSGLSIAICDTGIDTSHPRLGGSATFPNAKVIGGYDVGDSDADPRPGSTGEPHGTACAGIAAGSTGTVGDYIGGVAPDAKLYAIKISYGTGGSAYTSAMIAGWEWCVAHKNDDPANPILIISTSFGGGRYTTTCDSAVSGMTTAAANAVAAGITIFASSGNDGYCDSTAWPACISYVNSVGAVYDANFGTYYVCVNSASCATKTSTFGCSTGYYSSDSTVPDKVTSYSNSASFLTIFAPSNQASTTDIVGSGGYGSGDYSTTFGGTSAASPYAAGSAAVLQSAAKTLNGAYLTPAEVRTYLVSTGDNITDGKVAITKPRINLGKAADAVTSPLPIVAITPTDATATEAGPTTGEFTLSRTGESAAALTVNFDVTGTATPGSDYTGIGTSVTIPAGAASATIAVTPIDDIAMEGDETVIVTLSASAAYWLGTPSATMTIQDDEFPTLAEALDTTLTVTSGGDASWAAQMATSHDGVDAAQSGTVADDQSNWVQTTATGGGVSFWWRVSSENNYDYLKFSIDGVVQASISGEVTWEQKTFAMAAGSHTLRWEYSKDWSVSSGSDRGWVDQLVVSATTPPTVMVTSSDATATETGPTTGEFTVSRTGETTAALTVNFSVTGTATSGSDYASIGTSLTIPAGAASATVTVMPVQDAVVEADETVVLSLTTGFYLVGSPASATVTIQDDDGPTLAAALDTTLTVTSGGNLGWWGQTVTTHDGVDATQSGAVADGQSSWVQTTATGASVSFWWRVSSENNYDYLKFSIDGIVQASISGAVAWQQKTFAMAAGSHTLRWEYSKDWSVSSGSDRGWVDQLVVSATTPPTVTVTASAATATETGPTTGQFTVSRTGDTTAALTVTFAVTGTATSGNDYTSIGTSVTIPAGASSTTITVSPIDDTTVENDESVIVTLSANAEYIVGSPASASVTITSDDLPMVTIAADDATATEIGASNGQFTVTRTGSTTAALTVTFAVTGTAVSGSDYNNIGSSVTIPAGYASATISVMPIDDAEVESDETVIVTLSLNAAYSVGSPASATVTITSDDVWKSVKNDFDGDGRSDIGCYHPQSGNWYMMKSTEGFWQTQFGYAGTIPITGDFDGDGKSDIGCYHPSSGNWYVMKSTEGFWQTQFGYAGTIPIVGDFDGDGRDDFGCYHPPSGNWYVMKSTEGFWQTQFGYTGTIPIVGDFDGDGRDDFGCYHPSRGTWYMMKSTEGFSQTQFGYAGTIPIVGDFDGDGRDDFGCYHPPSGNWHLIESTQDYWQTKFGYAGTEPVVGDFDGDGKSDLGCYYPAGGNWYVMKSTEGFWQTQFGYGGTIPLGGTLR